MSIVAFLEQKGLPLLYADYANWPSVPEDTVRGKKRRERFLNLRTAATLYCESCGSLASVSKATGIPDSTLSYAFNRAMELDEDGRIYGERAFVKFAVRKDYESHNESANGLAGQFKRLLREHPDLEALVFECVKKSETLAETHKKFKNALYELGFTDDDYPLDSDSQGEWSLKALRKRLQREYFRDAALALGGEDAARNADVSQGLKLAFRVERAYQRIELDAHVLKAFFTIEIEELDGTVRTTTLKRLYVIAAIDSQSRAILGYHISMNGQPTIEDVASCLARVLDPTLDSQSDTLGFVAGQGVGLPDDIVLQTRYRAFSELAMDNALAHASPALHDNLIGHVCTTINLGKSRHPQGRALIEGWFKLLKKFLADPLPSATGSHPGDAKRRKPRTKARRYQISLADLEVLIESVIRGYNHEHPETTTGQSPLQKLKRSLMRTTGLVRRLRPGDRGLDFLFKRYYDATIAGSVKRGLRPYVQFKGAVYRNPQLSAMGSLIGKKVMLEVDIRDLRCIHCYLESGKSIGILQAQGGWANTPHSLQTRQAINRHRNRVRVRQSIGDYVQWYVASLANAEKRRADMPNITTRINDEIRRGLDKDRDDGLSGDGSSPKKPPSGSGHWSDIGPDIGLDEEDDEWT